jgi:hypothetical protein
MPEGVCQMNHMTESEKILAFISFCIEEYKYRLGAGGGKVADLFERAGVIDYLVAHYDILHSMGREAILKDIDQFIDARSGKT